MTQTRLPATHRVLYLTSTEEPLQVKTIPTPQPVPGSAIVRILVASVISYSGDIYNGKRKYPFPKPLIPGASAIGRIAAVGPDATTLKPGQLVFLDGTIRGRDDPSAIILSGVIEGFSEASAKLMHGGGYAKFPLENCIPLDEERLLGSVSVGGLGYSVEDLIHLATLLVPYGGLDDVTVKPGETVIVAPSTGQFGSAAVRVALAMGAGRLAAIHERVIPVKITGDERADAETLKCLGPADVFFDISPPMAAGSSHFKSAIAALKHSGRVSLMGGVRADVSFMYADFMHRNLSMKGTWMYSRDQIFTFLKLVYSGLLPLGEKSGLRIGGKFGLEQWKEAFEAASVAGMSDTVVIAP